MTQVSASRQDVITVTEYVVNVSPFPDQYDGVLYVPHQAHQLAKLQGKQVLLNNVSIDMKVEWLNSGFGKAGHTFDISWVNENGQYVGIFNLNPTTSANKTDEKTANLTAMFPNYQGCFGVNAFKINVTQVSPIGLQQSDDYRFTYTETIDYTVV